MIFSRNSAFYYESFEILIPDIAVKKKEKRCTGHSKRKRQFS